MFEELQNAFRDPHAAAKPQYKTIEEQAKERTIAQAAECEALKIFKRRLSTDDGWFYFTAKDRKTAEKEAGPGVKVVCATIGEVTLIAARALTGNY